MTSELYITFKCMHWAVAFIRSKLQSTPNDSYSIGWMSIF